MKNRDYMIIEYFLKNPTGSSSAVFETLQQAGVKASLVTIKRDLSRLSTAGVLAKNERGPETSYEITVKGRLSADIDARAYCAVEPDRRYGRDRYDFGLWPAIVADIFDEAEIAKLDHATERFQQKSRGVSETIVHKESERFVIELSWKSSKIEGNTYSLLDTERLIKEGISVPGKAGDEAAMILNHKAAFEFIVKHRQQFADISRPLVEEVHAMLVKDLGVGRGYRKGAVGITGSKYRPLENEHQIREAMDELFSAVRRIPSAYGKALLALVGIGYIQPFEDGNKRTSRLIANAILLSSGKAPLSYRSVDEDAYREAVLAFYELAALAPMKKIFIEQYLFAADNYLAI
ncbi:Fic family protein [Patescibacteria group bacterium]|nr:Fic family protein [Patescibacteria group bacterium]MDE1941431.1 Fic family protein [Patescibacteria group bacterium]